MITIIAYILLIFFNSIMDATENEPNFNESRLKKLPVQFWLKEQSWKYAPKLFTYTFDAWHIAKSCMIICMLVTIIAFAHEWPVKTWWDRIFYFVIGGFAWNALFWLFYHQLLGVKANNKK